MEILRHFHGSGLHALGEIFLTFVSKII